MRKTLHTLLLSCLVAVSLLCSLGCDDACLELAKKICSCETSTAKRRSCEYRVENETDAVTPTTEELERCGELLDTCNCDKLGAGDLEACGLAP